MMTREGAFVLATILVACASHHEITAVDASPDAPVVEVGNEDAGDASDVAVLDAGPSWGGPCEVADPTSCADGLFCLEGPSGGEIGFCTATCPRTSSAACEGTPPGTSAYCVVTDVNVKREKGCAFVCAEHGETFPCPGALHCQATEDPPGSGQRLCLP